MRVLVTVVLAAWLISGALRDWWRGIGAAHLGTLPETEMR